MRKERQQYYAAGATVIYYTAVDGAPAGFLALADVLRPDAAGNSPESKKPQVKPLLLLTETMAAAREIAGKAGIGNVRANPLLPEGKMQIIRDYDERGETVCG